MIECASENATDENYYTQVLVSYSLIDLDSDNYCSPTNFLPDKCSTLYGLIDSFQKLLYCLIFKLRIPYETEWIWFGVQL